MERVRQVMMVEGAWFHAAHQARLAELNAPWLEAGGQLCGVRLRAGDLCPYPATLPTVPARCWLHPLETPEVSPPPVTESAAPAPRRGATPAEREAREERRRADLQQARDALAAAPPMKPATLHEYGPHDESTAPQTVMVYALIRWPGPKFEDQLSDKIKAQRRQINTRAHQDAVRRVTAESLTDDSR